MSPRQEVNEPYSEPVQGMRKGYENQEVLMDPLKAKIVPLQFRETNERERNEYKDQISVAAAADHDDEYLSLPGRKSRDPS